MIQTLAGTAPGAGLVSASPPAGNLIPVGLLLLAAATLAAVIIVLSMLVGPRRSRAGSTPYECGSIPFVSARHPFSVKFYIVAMLFILFDVEAAFLFPWAVAFRRAVDLGEAGPGAVFVLVEMLVFLGILVAGLVYVWRRGALEWGAK
jgi:NADH-quinone oxidoreductase subunit A